MSNFKNIEKLGIDLLYAYQCDKKSTVIHAEDLEHILQSAQVVYGPDKRYWNDMKEAGDNYSAILLAITPIKKKTKAEAALELLERLAKDCDKLIQPEWHVKEAKRILEMKDEV